MTPARMAVLHRASFTTPRPWTEAEFTDLLARPGTLMETAEHGFALLRVTMDEAELLTIATAPDARGRGIAGEMLSRILARAAEAGARACFLEVAADNGPARRLYARAGFALVGMRRQYYRMPDGTATDAIVMGLDLPKPQPATQGRIPAARESY